MGREFRVTVTVAEHGRREGVDGRLEQLVDSYAQIHPDAGAVAGANLQDGTAEVTFSLEAESLADAGRRWEPIFRTGFEASGLAVTKLRKLEIEPAD
jgi:hypothetical protein